LDVPIHGPEWTIKHSARFTLISANHVEDNIGCQVAKRAPAA
jgi:hypothetical protein